MARELQVVKDGMNKARVNKTRNHRHPWSQEIKTWNQFQDELKVQAHLFKADLKDAWKKREKNWKKFLRKMTPLLRNHQKLSAELGGSTRRISQSIHGGYDKIKQGFSSSRFKANS